MPPSLYHALWSAFAVALVALAGCDAADPDSGVAPGPNAVTQTPDADVIPGQYVVVLSERPADAARRADLADLVSAVRARPDAEVQHEYAAALTGFAARLSPEALAILEADPRVAYVVPDQAVHASGNGSQTPATWGLDRIDQRNRPINNTYNWNTSGEGVTVYVIDTGVRITHNEFGGRASYGYDYVDNDPIADDCNGHGTHVAGTAAGATYGVAKDAAVVAFRVLPCSGPGDWSDAIAAVDWVTANHVAPAVANMSLGSPTYAPANAAVANSIAAGVAYAVAAGNDYNQNACNYSPAGVTTAMTIGSTTSSDARSSFSNSGSCIDWFAPGSSITSAWYTSNTDTAILSGTSMATPHAAGVAALYLEANPAATPQQVRDALYDATTKDIVTSANSTNDHLLYSLVAAGSSPSITLNATLFIRDDGRWRIKMTWSGASSTNVDGYRDGAYAFTTPNDGAHKIVIRPPAGGSTTLRICEQGSTTACSNEVTVSP